MKQFAIAAAQSDSTKGDVAANVRRHAEFVRLAAEHHVDVVVFPELSLTGYEPTIAAATAIRADDPLLTPLQELADDRDIAIIAGCPIRSSENRPYIGAFILNRGQPVSVYRKRFLHGDETKHFIASTDTVVFESHGQSVGVAICADITHSAHAADAASNGATIYAAGVMMTPGGIVEAATKMSGYANQHRLMTVMANYANETGGYATGGRSAVWDESGEHVVQANPQGCCLVVATKDADHWTGRVLDCN